jgi:hypothetical protein
MTKTIKIEKEIPEPPQGWHWEDRHPHEYASGGREPHMRLVGGGQDWVFWYDKERFGEIAYEFAYRNKSKCLLTPEEQTDAVCGTNISKQSNEEQP